MGNSTAKERMRWFLNCPGLFIILDMFLKAQSHTTLEEPMSLEALVRSRVKFGWLNFQLKEIGEKK